MEEKDLKDLFKILGRLEAKQELTCRAITDLTNDIKLLESRFQSLPCETHTTNMLMATNTKVSWSHFWALLVVLISLSTTAITGAYFYTHAIDKELKAHVVSPTHTYHIMQTPIFHEDDYDEPK
jgi:hypothetical protein